ncbi:hypothetical protein OIE66_43145 [Nonomuraea sp. NBC_01738]|uniref:hypothetical protein n=1 Tax=Nonomuraea sp. NBC_01738 TaxID=2976003 RepID=UPI002E113378|nr:hypothetical protein OIE66_43145 [Nonomuraea sp. NBC_01738]
MPSVPVLRRVRNLAVLEFVNIPLLSWAFIGMLGMPVTPANLTGLLLVFVILVEGGAYWFLKLGQFRRRAPLPAGMPLFRMLTRLNPVLLAIGALVIAVAIYSGDSGTAAWPGVALWVFAVLEHVNYFHVQLIHDTRADLARFRRTGRFHRSHLATDLARSRLYRQNPSPLP